MFVLSGEDFPFEEPSTTGKGGEPSVNSRGTLLFTRGCVGCNGMMSR